LTRQIIGHHKPGDPQNAQNNKLKSIKVSVNYIKSNCVSFNHTKSNYVSHKHYFE